MKKLLLLFSIVFAICVEGQVTFFNRINHPGYSSTIKVLSDGNLIVGAMDTSAFIQKTDSSGTIIWQRRLPIWWVEMVEVEEAADHGIFVLMNQPYLQGRCTYVLKLRSDGSTEWYYIYHDMANDHHWDIQAMPDTGFLMVGNGCTAPGAQLTRCRKDGSIRWQRNYIDNTGQYFGFTRVTLCDNGRNFFFVGFTTVPTVDRDLAVGKIDTAGNMLWMKEFSQPGTYENPMAVVATKSGFVVAYDAIIFQSATSYSRNSLAAFDTAGNMVWHTRYTFNHGATGRSLALLADTTLLVGGMVLYDQDTSKYRALLIHTSPMGQQLSSPSFSDSIYGDYSCQYVESIATSGNNAYLTGGGYSMYIAKTNNQGYGICNPQYNGPITTYLSLPPAIIHSCYTSPGYWTQIPTSSFLDSAITLQGYPSCVNVITSSTNHGQENSWSLVPNYSSNSWVVSSDQIISADVYTIELRDMHGRSIPIQVNSIDPMHVQFSVPSDVAEGIYLVSIVSKGIPVFNEKLLIQH